MELDAKIADSSFWLRLYFLRNFLFSDFLYFSRNRDQKIKLSELNKQNGDRDAGTGWISTDMRYLGFTAAIRQNNEWKTSEMNVSDRELFSKETNYQKYCLSFENDVFKVDNTLWFLLKNHEFPQFLIKNNEKQRKSLIFLCFLMFLFKINQTIQL